MILIVVAWLAFGLGYAFGSFVASSRKQRELNHAHEWIVALAKLNNADLREALAKAAQIRESDAEK